MGASFPNSIASFSTKRNLLDDVEAGDINKIQDEIVAVESALGDDMLILQEIEQDVTELQDEVNSINAFDKTVINRFKSLKEIINAIWNGTNVYGATASARNLPFHNTAKDRPYPPGRVNLQKPSTDNDPRGMWNGTGFTLKKSGLWVLNGYVQVNLDATGGSSNANFGTYEGSLTLNGTDWTRAVDRQYPVADKTWHDVMLNPTIIDWFPKGTKVTLRAAQSSDRDQRITQARLAVVRLRGR